MTPTRQNPWLPTVLAATAALAASCGISIGEESTQLDAPEQQLQIEATGDDEQGAVSPIATQQDDESPSANPSSEDARTETTPEFCEAGRTVFESFVVLDLTPQDAPRGVVEPAMVQLLVDINLALELAPNEELAVGPQIAFVSMNNIRNAAKELGYDGIALEAAASEGLRADYDNFLGVMDALVLYLEGPCGIDLAETNANADARLRELKANVPTEPTPDPIAAPEVRTVEGEWSGIVVTVPASWAIEESWSDEQSRGLAVAPDLGAFDSSWQADGLAITAFEIADGSNLDLDTIIAASAAAKECAPAGQDAYADGVYTGRIHRFQSCGGGATGAAAIAAASDDQRLLVLVEIQMIDFDEAVLTTIANSFRA